MAKFDSQYPELLQAEEGDMLLIVSQSDGKVMKISLATLKEQVQHHLDVIDEQLSITSDHPVQNKVITEAVRKIRLSVEAGAQQIEELWKYAKKNRKLAKAAL